MAKDAEVLLTTQQVEEWEKEAQALAKKIADDEAHLAELRLKLKSAAPFMPKKPSFFDSLAKAKAIAASGQAEATVNGGDNLTEAIERIANEQVVSKKELKKMLEKEGFPASQLANYFYTAIHRLKAKNRITVNEDGNLGPVF